MNAKQSHTQEPSKYRVPALEAGATSDTAALTIWGLHWGERAIGAEYERDALRAEVERLRAWEKEARRLLDKALNRSARVHPGFADEIEAALGGQS